ncbi:MAG: phage protease [Bacteroidales bacterium]
MIPSFILNDESKKNDHDFYLLNAGGNFERFTANPAMLHNHKHDLLIGNWQNLRVEGSLLLADPNFDDQDADGAKYKGQAERGFLRGASPGIRVLCAEWRKNAEGEEELYVTDWELYEGSTCPIPSNSGALCLKVYDSNYKLLSEDNVMSYLENIVKLSAENTNQKNINPQKNMEIKQLSAQAQIALGVKEDADVSAINAAIITLKAKADMAEKNYQELQTKIQSDMDQKATELVELAIKDGRITADKKNAFLTLAKADFQTAKTTLEAIPTKQNLATQLRPIGESDIPAERKDWTLLTWMQKDITGLNALKASDPQAYATIKSK